MRKNPYPKKRPTLADVARLAGVSLGSASRALSVPDELKPATLKKVKLAIEQLGYIPHGSARALASRKTKLIAAFYPTLNNPIFAASTHSMQQTLYARGYQLMIVSHEYYRENQLDLLRTTLSRGVDGLIMTGTDHNPAIFQLLEQHAIPYVLTWSTDDSKHPYCVGISNFQSAYELAKYVISFGHTKLGICGGAIEHNERARGRRLGVIAAAKEAGIDIPEKWIVEKPFSYEAGKEVIHQYLSLDEHPSAIFFGTDILAIGALAESNNIGIKIPDTFSIIGFDGTIEGRMMQPSLATMALPADTIGQKAANIMADLLEGKHVETQQPIPGKVLAGASLGKPV